MTKVLEVVSTIKMEVLDKEFTVYGNIDDPLFLAKDVAEWIDYAKTSQGYYDVSTMLNTVDVDEKCKNTSTNNSRSSWFLTEDGLYEVLFQSRKPIAKAVKKEVKSVLKTLRKEGVVVSDTATHEQVIYNVDLFMSNLNNFDITKLYGLIDEFLQYQRANKTRLAYKNKSKTRHGNKKYKSHIESMEEIREHLVEWLNVQIDKFNTNQQLGLAHEFIKIRELVRVSVENMRYRTAATSK
ncbi:hypothetical protein LYSIN_01208 [Lysinibacillus sphaericus]|uniref:Bro-N domain-containing protein n=1 Tax=Lysinibacillus sphaericus TaxID=1421 RepID=A0A2S5D048_LYSSH|nr:BRO family protein [Lysinibacillus sphaericus]POZ56425.1 hypothetical protein LYSIN_01208 [Lysinibacillus sphaericus]